MKILTVENKVLDLDRIPEELEEDIRFSILDNSNPKDPDFFFQPLFFMDCFTSPAMVLQIGEFHVTLPIDWSIIVGDFNTGCDVEILPLTSLNGRGFDTLCFNPLTSYRLEFKHIKITNFYNDVTWYFPKLKTNHLLSVPLSDNDNTLCVFIIKDYTRNSEIIDLSKLL